MLSSRLERTVFDAKRPGGPPKFTVKQQQWVIALACTKPPDGYARWTLKLLCRESGSRKSKESKRSVPANR